jgi:DNA repair exonuclease SbcCD ATPase subunit
MSENELLFDIPSNVTSSLVAMEESRKIKNTIKSKERELDKAQSELEYNERDTSLHKSYAEQKYNAEVRKSNRLSSNETSMESELERIERLVNEHKTKLEIYQAKIESQIKTLESQRDGIQKKYDDRKKKIEVEEDGHIGYFERALEAIASKKSTPKIRGLEADIVNLYRDLMRVDKLAYGGLSLIPDKPYLEEIKEEWEKVREESNISLEPPPPPKSREYIFSNYTQPSIQSAYPTIIGDTKKKREPKKPTSG